MCGSATSTTSTRNNVQPPDRHQVRHAIRKVARAMRKNRETRSLFSVKGAVMDHLPTASLSSAQYTTLSVQISKSLEKSTFFTTTGGCGGTELTVRKTASL